MKMLSDVHLGYVGLGKTVKKYMLKWENQLK